MFCNCFACPVSVLQLICMSCKWLIDDRNLCSQYVLVELVSWTWFIFDGSSYTLCNWVIHLIFICSTNESIIVFFIAIWIKVAIGEKMMSVAYGYIMWSMCCRILLKSLACLGCVYAWISGQLLECYRICKKLTFGISQI